MSALTISQSAGPEESEKVRETARLLMILDVNGVIVKTQGKGRYSVRPGVKSFLAQLHELIKQGQIELAFWTSKPSDTAEPILQDLVPKDLLDKTLFIWYREACTPTVIDGNPFHTIKDLEQVWMTFPQFSKKNTFLVDDTPSKCPDQPDNLIIAPPYLGPRNAPNDAGLTTIFRDITSKIEEAKGASD